MPLLHSLLKVVKDAWHRRRGAPRSRLRSNISLERLDHRQLLSVTFTGNAKADIPDNIGPGFAIVQNSQKITIDPTLASQIKVSGFDIDAIRMFYSAEDDTLSFAIQQPGNQKTSPELPVIAGDADNNLNGGTVSPTVQALQPLFRDFANLGGSETMYVFLSLKNNGIPDVVAGISNNPGVSKLYQVADAVVNPNPIIAANSAPQFGTPLPQNTGYSFLYDTDPLHGAFEFQITNFSQLYKQETGLDLTTTTTVGVGAFSGSADDFSSELFIKAQPVTFGVVPPSDCPPLSPPVIIAPHQNRHINTAHASLVRVTVFGTSGFDVDNIVDGSVSFGGAQPVFSFKRHVNRDKFEDVTYVFRSDQLNLPPGVQFAAITGKYKDPTTDKVLDFSSSNQIYVKDTSSYSAAQIQAQQARLARTGDPIPGVPPKVEQRARLNDVTIDENASAELASVTPANTVKIATRQQRLAASRSTVISRAPGFQQQRAVVLGAQNKGTQLVALKAQAASRRAAARANAHSSMNAMDMHDMALDSLAS